MRNNPIQTSSLSSSSLARLQQIFTLLGRILTCLNLPARSIGGTRVYTVFIIEWNEQCKYELISSLQLHYHTLNSGLTMAMFTFHINLYLLSTFPQFSKVTPTCCLVCPVPTAHCPGFSPGNINVEIHQSCQPSLVLADSLHALSTEQCKWMELVNFLDCHLQRDRIDSSNSSVEIFYFFPLSCLLLSRVECPPKLSQIGCEDWQI